MFQDRSRIGYHYCDRLVLAQASKHGGLAEQRMCHLDGLTKGPRQPDSVLDQPQGLLGPPTCRQRNPERQRNCADGLLRAVLPSE